MFARTHLSTHRSLAELNRRTLFYSALLAVIIAGSLLRACQLGDKSLWIDEAFSVWMGRQPVPEMLSWLVRIDQHPPLYYLSLGLWMQAGDTFGQMAAPRSTSLPWTPM